ncbi:MAG: cob(I)yrinic acid a,c-diamide adenosyltransferase [Endomicrobiia bacterium]
MEKKLTHLYTGDGKGKTTASLGLLLRALGHGWKVCFVTFQKDPQKYGYGEFKVLKKLKNVKIYNFAKVCPYFTKKYDIEKLKLEISNSVKFIKTDIFRKNYDLVIIDEILVCVREKLLDLNDIKDLIKNKPLSTELVLTGQANKTIIDKLRDCVDYISYVKKLKHPYDKGIKRRKGIEY